MQAWAQRLNRWGYVALVVDSFGPRGYPDGICTKGSLVPPEERARDAFAAAAWLRTQTFVDGAHIGVVGFSHGGWTIMRAILEPTVREAGATPFQAAVAYYPYCPFTQVPIASDTLILIGDADDWTPAPRCTSYVAAQIAPSHALDIKVYPRATHAFDVMAASRTAFGHFMAYDRAAADDSFEQTRRFFDARLKARAD
jgi:dienelactone hydrolase